MRIGIIGAGFGGLAAAVELRRGGYDDITIWEKGDDVGGVWRDNTYPGAACDVPSPFYSLSYAPNPRWPRRFSAQPAILDYIRSVTDRFDLRRHLRLGVEVEAAAYDDETGTWTVSLGDGSRHEVDVLVSAVGQLSRPALPAIEGRERFAGASFHSARWDHSIDLSGKRVAVVGTGASAIQFVPEIAGRVQSLTLFQRTPPHIVPRPDTHYAERHHALFERVPLTQLAERATWYGLVESLSIAFLYAKPLSALVTWISRAHMRRQTRSRPGLFEKVWPDYPVGCKRILFSSDYLPALTRDNVEVVTDRITQFEPAGVRTADGTVHEVDVIIYGTGFAATEFLAPMRITGRGGRELHEEWALGAHAYYGVSVPDFPGLLMMYGPNTNTGGGSILYFLETQARHLRAYVERRAELGVPLQVRRDVEEAFDRRVQSRLAGSVWAACSSWYRLPSGRIPTNWPDLGIRYRQLARFDAADYEAVPGA